MRIRREGLGKGLLGVVNNATGAVAQHFPASPPSPYKVDTVVQQINSRCRRAGWQSLPGVEKPDPNSQHCADVAETIIKQCESQKLTTNCHDIVVQGVEKYCKDHSSDKACDWLKTITTTSGTNLLPFIIGGVVGVIVLLAIGIGFSIYCRKKKKASAPGQSMTGTTGGGSTTGSFSGTGTGNRSGTGMGPGTGTTATNTAAKY